MEANDKKLLGNKKVLFSVIKPTTEPKEVIQKSQNVSTTPKISEKNKLPKFVKLQERKVDVAPSTNPQTAQSKTETNVSSDNASNEYFEAIKIKSRNVEWLDRTNMTFRSLINKYQKRMSHLETSLLIDESNNTFLSIDNESESVDYYFKLFFVNNPNVHSYPYSEIKNMNLKFFEMKHKGKLSEIYIDTIDRKRKCDFNFKENETKFEQYKLYINRLLFPNKNNNSLNEGNKLDFDLFVLEHPECFDWIENYIISKIAEKFSFNDYQSYINLYLYDNFRKLRDTKSIDLLKNRIRDSPCLNRDLSAFEEQITGFYNYRLKHFKKNFQEVGLDQAALIEVFLSAFIYSKLKTTSEIDLTQHYIQSENMMTILSALKLTNELEKLNLSSNKIGEGGMWQLGRVFYYNSRISELDLSINSLTDDSVKFLLSGLFNCKLDAIYEIKTKHTFSFVKLNLSGNSPLTSQCGASIAKIVEVSPYLKSLNLSKNNLEDEGMLPIIESLKKNNSVETIILFGTKIGKDSCLKFADYLSSNDCPLLSLILSDNKIDFEAAKALFKSLRHNKHLEELSMMNCELGNEVAEEIEEMILTNEALKCLYLYNNKIDRESNFVKILNACRSDTPNYKSPCKLALDEIDICDRFFNIDSVDPNENIYDLDSQPKCDKTNDMFRNAKIEDSFSNVIANKELQFGKDIFPPMRVSKLTYLDLSKNRCKLNVDENFLNIIENLKLDSLDISQNMDFTSLDATSYEKFKKLINKVQDKTKIIY